MAETYTDAKGNVFPVDAYGRPQGYWQNNQFIYPQFGKNFAAAQPDVAPVQPVQPVKSVDVYRLPSSVQEQQREEDSVGGDPTKYTFDRGAADIAGGSGNTALQGGGDKFGTVQYSGGGLFGGPGLSGAQMQGLGGTLGRMTGVPGAGLLGGIAGGLAGNRGGRGIVGDVIGTGLGTLAFGPVGGLLGIVGGRLGDLSDMERGLDMSKHGQRGFWSTLGYGIGLGPSLVEQMQDYYGVNLPGPTSLATDPFGGGAPRGGHHPGVDYFEDDIGDIDPGVPDDEDGTDVASQVDSFGEIADAFGGTHHF